MATYTITPPQGINFCYDIEAEGIAFERHHILFMDIHDNPILALHSDEVRRVDID
jgi:hypothetical protein